jgi:hypothetical protein
VNISFGTLPISFELENGALRADRGSPGITIPSSKAVREFIRLHKDYVNRAPLSERA